MSLSDITEKIISESKVESNIALSAASAYVDGVKKQTEEKISEIKNTENKVISKEVSEHKDKLLSDIKHNDELVLISKKRELVDGVFVDVLSKLNNLSESQYIDLIASYLNTLPAGLIDASCVVPVKRKEETEKAIKDIGLSLKIVTTDLFESGFIVKTSDAEFDMRLERLLNNKKKSLESEVARILFN